MGPTMVPEKSLGRLGSPAEILLAARGAFLERREKKRYVKENIRKRIILFFLMLKKQKMIIKCIESYPKHIQNIPKTYPKHTQNIPKTTPKHTRNIPQSYPKHAPTKIDLKIASTNFHQHFCDLICKNFRSSCSLKIFKNVKKNSKRCWWFLGGGFLGGMIGVWLGYVSGMFRGCFGYVLDMFWVCSRYVLGIFWVWFGYVLGMFWIIKLIENY